MANRRWHNPGYRNYALPILNSMWETEVATVSGQLYLTAGNWASSQNEIVINPSYFAPYEWRVFAQEDKRHNWQGLIQPAYDLLTRAGQAPLDKGTGVGLPPDWVSLSKDGQLQPTNLPNLNSDYSFDAIRIPWRIALDYQQYGDKRAYNYLQTLGFFAKQYEAGKKLYESYSHDGKPLSNGESPVMYATSLGVLMNTRPEVADQIYQEKILNLYSTDSNSFRQNLSYYEENWLWFGSALYLKALYKF
jgi:endoglucanase